MISSLMISKKDIEGLEDLTQIKKVFQIKDTELKAYCIYLDVESEINANLPLCSGNASKYLRLSANGRTIDTSAFGLAPIKRCCIKSVEISHIYKNYLVTEKVFFSKTDRKQFTVSAKSKQTYQGVGTSMSSWKKSSVSSKMKKVIKCLFREDMKGMYGISFIYEYEEN